MKNLLLFLALISPLFTNAQWQSANLDSVAITSLDVNDSSIFVGTTGGVYISNNFGGNWTYSGFNPNIYKVNSVAQSGTNLFAGTNNRMVISTNGGNSWGSIFTFVNFPVYDILATGSNIFSASAFGVHISTNNGGQWTSVSTGLPPLSTTNHLAAMGTDIFALADSVVYLSTNNGGQWDSVNTGLTNNPVRVLAVNGSTIFAGTNNGVYISLNSGGLWTAFSNGLPASPVYSIVISGNNIFDATDSGVYISNNNGGLWTSINTGLPIQGIRHLAISGTKIFAVLSSQTTFGELWSRPLSQVTGIEENSSENYFNLYPNPSTGKFGIESAEIKIQKLEVYNLMGENVFSLYNSNGISINEIDLMGFSGGIYFLDITDEERNVVKRKMVIE